MSPIKYMHVSKVVGGIYNYSVLHSSCMHTPTGSSSCSFRLNLTYVGHQEKN